MGQVFISYRHVEPDKNLARALAAALEARRYPVFVDTQIEVGTRWVAEIDRQIRASSHFVVVLSEDSIRSDMVRQEVALAHQLELKGEMRILQIRAGLDGELPYDLASYLNPIQYARWSPGEPFETVCRQLIAAIEKAAALPFKMAATSDSSIDEAAAAASPNTGFGLEETGTVRLNSPYYVARRADARMEEALRRDEGETLVIKGAWQSGKSSLLVRAHALMRKRGQKAVYLDLQRQLEERHLASLGSLLRNLAARIARELGTEAKPSELWDEDLGDKESFAEFLETAFLSVAEESLLLCLDEVDRLFHRPYRTDFFAALRGWQTKRAIEPAWERLHLAIAHSSDPAAWIDDINQSPFNVGDRLHLEDFTAADISDLATRHRMSLSGADVDRLRLLVGGRPYLVRRALHLIATGRWSLQELCRLAADDRGPFRVHLRQHLWILHRNVHLCAALKSVLDRGACNDEPDFQQLRTAGLIDGERRQEARLRCDLYRDYFRRHL